jgi:hypothetical protein
MRGGRPWSGAVELITQASWSWTKAIAPWGAWLQVRNPGHGSAAADLLCMGGMDMDMDMGMDMGTSDRPTPLPNPKLP